MSDDVDLLAADASFGEWLYERGRLSKITRRIPGFTWVRAHLVPPSQAGEPGHGRLYYGIVVRHAWRLPHGWLFVVMAMPKKKR